MHGDRNTSDSHRSFRAFGIRRDRSLRAHRQQTSDSPTISSGRSVTLSRNSPPPPDRPLAPRRRARPSWRTPRRGRARAESGSIAGASTPNAGASTPTAPSWPRCRVLPSKAANAAHKVGDHHQGRDSSRRASCSFVLAPNATDIMIFKEKSVQPSLSMPWAQWQRQH